MNILTHSSMTTFRNCRKQYYYRYELGLTPKRRKASLSVGSALHKGLEYYYSGRELEDCLLEALAVLDEVDKAFWDQENYDDLEKQKAVIVGMLTGYHQFFNDRASFQKVLPELEFNVPILNPATGSPSKTFVHAGKIDALVVQDGQYWLREFKTATQIDKAYFDRLKLDTQITSYIDALQTARNIRISGIIYTILKKPSIRQKQSESLTAYCDRVIQDYQDRPAFYFYEDRFYRDQADLIEWQYDRWDISKDILEARKNERWYRNTSYCSQYGGCSFLPLCCNGEEMLHFYKQELPHTELSEETKGKHNGQTTECYPSAAETGSSY